MKKSIKSYLVFTSCSYRIWGLIIVPFLLAGMAIGAVFRMKLNALQLYWVAQYVLAFEIFSDYWMFGGICENQTRKLEYLKTSLRGISVLRNGLVVDLLRRAIYIFLFSAICYAGNGQLQSFVMGAGVYLVATAALNVSRYMTNIQHQLVVSMFAMLPMGLFGALAGYIERRMPGNTFVVGLELAVLIILAVIAGMITVWHAINRVKGSYYDKKCD